MPKGEVAIASQAESALEPAIQHCGERDAVFRQTHLERFVFEQHLGEQSWDELQGEISSNPELIKIEADLRQEQLAQDYLKLSPEDRAKTLLLAGTNQERLALTQTLRAAPLTLNQRILPLPVY